MLLTSTIEATIEALFDTLETVSAMRDRLSSVINESTLVAFDQLADEFSEARRAAIESPADNVDVLVVTMQGIARRAEACRDMLAVLHEGVRLWWAFSPPSRPPACYQLVPSRCGDSPRMAAFQGARLAGHGSSAASIIYGRPRGNKRNKRGD